MSYDTDYQDLDGDDGLAAHENFGSYHRMVEQLRQGKEDPELLKTLYPSIPATYKFELLIKCASLPHAPNCFAFLFDQLSPNWSVNYYEINASRVLDCLLEHNCVQHLEHCFNQLNLPDYRVVSSVARGVSQMSTESLELVLSRALNDVAASALNQALGLSLGSEKYAKMVNVIAPFCQNEHLPHVVLSVLETHFQHPTDNALGVVNDFVTSLPPVAFKKVYQKIHVLVKEHNIEEIRARYSKDKMLSQLETVAAPSLEENTAAVRRKM